MSVDFTPHAVYDIDIAADYLDAEREGGGTRFREDLRRTFERLEWFSESAELYEPPSAKYPGLRVAQPSRFIHYAVYYQPSADGILVVRVLHTARLVAAIFGDEPPMPQDS